MGYRHVVLERFGGPENLVIKDIDAPIPAGAGQIGVRVLAAGMGFTDCIIRAGEYVQVKDKPPFTPGYDWYGVVEEVGDGVSDLQVGDYVADLSVIGGYTEYLIADADRVVKAPQGLDPAEAVAMLLSYSTAYQMLTRITPLHSGMTVLVHAAGGAVGTALLDLCRHFDLRVLGTGSAAKKEVIESFGGIAIDYRHDSIPDSVRRHAPEGVDAVFDTLGGRSWRQSYPLLKRGGWLIGFGALQANQKQESIPSLLLGFAQLLGVWRLIPDGRHSTFYNIQSRRETHPEEFKEDVQSLFALLKDRVLTPAIAHRVTLDQVPDVHRLLDRGDIAGKVAILM